MLYYIANVMYLEPHCSFHLRDVSVATDVRVVSLVGQCWKKNLSSLYSSPANKLFYVRHFVKSRN